MASSGRISLLVSSPLATLVQAVKGMDKEVTAQIRKHTKPVAEPVWQEAVRGNVTDRLQTRVLSDTARVAVSDSNIMLRSGGIGKMTNGTPKSLLASAAEFGADPNKRITSHTKAGKAYTRRRGAQFKLPRSRGYVVFPAAREVIPRIASLWVQTAVRTVHEVFEKGGVRG
ncbi:hypothetical protein [Parafrigoribacterium humi]|uniref:hypothetical protein n=1 Tax=Parafrigoribacterium humi TaxID=3144664 RepID=UPI0032EF6768